MKIFKIDLDMIRQTKGYYIELAEDDYGSSQLEITLQKEGQAYDLTGVTAIEIPFKTPRGKIYVHDLDNGVEITDAATGKVTCTISAQALGDAGRVFFDVRIFSGFTLATSTPMTLYVRRPIITDGVITDMDQYPLLQTLIIQCQAITDEEAVRVAQETAREVAEGLRQTAYTEAEATRNTSYSEAEGTRDGLYAAAEGARNNNYDLAEGEREGLYDAAEGARNNNYDLAEGEREGLYDAAEEARTSAFNLAEGIRESNETTRCDNEVIRVANENARLVFEAYNNSTQYVVGNKVTYYGSSYRCIKNSLGNTPIDAEYWLLIAQKGGISYPTFSVDDNMYLFMHDDFNYEGHVSFRLEDGDLIQEVV